MSFSILKSIFKTIFNIEVTRLKEYKVSAICEILTNITYLVINLVFWRSLFDIGYNVNGWSYADIIVFIAYSELFFGLYSAAFANLSRFWQYIVTGTLDIYLVRPIDSRLRMFLFNIKYIGLIKTIIFFTILLIYSGKEFTFLGLIFSFCICIIGLIIFALIQLCISYTSFYFGKVESLNEISDSITMVNKYPTTILPSVLQMIFKTVLPFYFFSTLPAEILTGKINFSNGFMTLVFMFVCLGIWVVLHNFIWKRGLEKYESYNG